MLRNKVKQHSRYSRFARTLLLTVCTAVGLGSVTTQRAHAHGLLLSWGTVVVHPDRVQTRIEVCAEDFVHYYQLRLAQDEFAVSAIKEAVAQHGHHLLDQFIIRDLSGRRLHGTIVDVKWNVPLSDKIGYAQLRNIAITYTLDHPTGCLPRFLTFQQHFGGANTSMPVQLAVSVTSAGNPVERFIRLTSRGNVETLQFAWPDSDSKPPVSVTNDLNTPSGHVIPDMGRNRFKSVYAFIYMDEVDVRCDIYMPLVLLETWLPVKRANVDFLDIQEMTAAKEQIHAFFMRRIPSRVNGKTALPTVAHVSYISPDASIISSDASFISPDASLIDKAEPAQRLGAWSARVCVRLKYLPHAPVTQMELEWNLFNSIVLNAHVVTVFNDVRTKHLVTTYAPKIMCPIP